MPAFLGAFGFLGHGFDILVAIERRRISSGSAHIGGRLNEHRLVGEVGAFREIQIHQPLLHGAGLADAAAQRIRR